MKSLMFGISIVAALTLASGLMGCNTKSDTVSQITVTPANQFMAKKSTQQFTANATFTNGMIINFTQVVVWSSSDPSVAQVNNTAGQNGIVTSLDIVGQGTTTISAFDAANNITGTATLTVADPDSIQIVPTNCYMPVNVAHQFSAIALFTGGTNTQLITLSANWPPSSAGLVTIVNTPGVAGNGIVTAGAVPGTDTIQAQDPVSKKTGAATIRVINSLISSVTVSPVTPIISLSTTTTQTFTAVGTFQDGITQTLPDTSWAWSSSNPAVASIDYYTGIATAVNTGAVTITATDLITGVAGNTTFTIQ